MFGVVYFLLILMCAPLGPSQSFAETLVLKSGKELQGKIVENTADYLAIDCGSGPLYFEHNAVRAVIVDQLHKEQDVSLQSPEEFLDRGIALAAEEKLEEAAFIFSEGLKQFPDDRNLEAALRIINDVSSGNVTREYAIKVFCGARALTNQLYETALKELLDAVRENPEDTDVYYNIAVAYQGIERHHDALRWLSKLTEARPEDAEAHALMGIEYYLIGNSLRARQSLIVARELFRKQGILDKAEEIEQLLRDIK
ncbi:MAG: tetratricopeptide repeat protein [Candidatus Omnitrophica bacterium]|nr:tetratricopeptide repeat protein [Candidatus Omnitrophota bacterium]